MPLSARPCNGDDGKRAASKNWCDSFIEALEPFHVTTYLNNAMPETENEMRCVFSEETMKRLRALKKKHDPDGMFKVGVWQYETNT